MSMALQRVTPGAIEAPAIDYNTEQLQVIKDIYAKGASDAEFRLFLEVSKHRKLDIFKKQIHLMKFWDRERGGYAYQPVTGIDGYRSIAERTGEYEGQTPPQWCGGDGIWCDVWLDDNPPAAARIGVYRTGFREPVWAVARYRSYFQVNKNGEPNSVWAKMPDAQLLKCAESLALRKAFPEQLGGLYTRDEMEQATEPSNGSEGAPAVRQPRAPRSYQAVPAAVSTITSEEKALDEALLAHCEKEKGEKNAPIFFKAKYGSKSLDEKRVLAKSLGLRVEWAPALDVPQVVEAEIVEDHLVEPEPAVTPAHGEIQHIWNELYELGCKPDHLNAKIAKLTGGVYAADEIEEADLPKVRMMLNNYVAMRERAATEMAKEFKQ